MSRTDLRSILLLCSVGLFVSTDRSRLLITQWIEKRVRNSIPYALRFWFRWSWLYEVAIPWRLTRHNSFDRTNSYFLRRRLVHFYTRSFVVAMWCISMPKSNTLKSFAESRRSCPDIFYSAEWLRPLDFWKFLGKCHRIIMEDPERTIKSSKQTVKLGLQKPFNQACALVSSLPIIQAKQTCVLSELSLLKPN
jgi:hypothetical protein